MSLTDEIDKRTEDVVEEENDFAGYVEVGGPYLVEVTDAYDSGIVYPDNDKRHIGMTIEVVEPLLDQQMGETEDELEERKDQIGRISSVRVYMTKKTVKTALGLLGGISGKMHFPEDFDNKAKQRDEDGNVVTDDSGNPTYDFSFVGENAPVNPENLIGRRFNAYFEYDEYKDRQDMNMFRSAALSSEEKQEEGPVDLFQGEDTRSAEYKKEMEKRQENSGRDELMEDEEGGDNELDPEDELPF